jgi:prepilin-type N-terminal cleavage/methylation domain-containing protein
MRQGTGIREPGTGTHATLRAVGDQAGSLSAPRAPNPGPRSPVPGTRRGRGAGFTLIELIIVIAIIGILATIAVPAMRTAPQRARESALKEDLFTLRSCIDQFHADRGRYPASLEELISLGYLRALPVDPITRSADTWQVEYPEVSEEDTEREEEEGVGIIDVRSGAEGTALDGTLYADW